MNGFDFGKKVGRFNHLNLIVHLFQVRVYKKKIRIREIVSVDDNGDRKWLFSNLKIDSIIQNGPQYVQFN